MDGNIASIFYNGLAVVFFLVIVFLAFYTRPWFLDYRFRGSGIEIVSIGGRVRVGTLARDRIGNIRVVPLADYTRLDRLAAFSLPNRFKSEFILVDTTYLIRLWALTPADPHQALAELTRNAEDVVKTA